MVGSWGTMRGTGGGGGSQELKEGNERVGLGGPSVVGVSWRKLGAQGTAAGLPVGFLGR